MNKNSCIVLGYKYNVNIDDVLLNENLFNFISKSFINDISEYINERISYLIDDDYILTDKKNNKSLITTIINKSNKKIKNKKNIFVELKQQLLCFILDHLSKKIKDLLFHYQLTDELLTITVGYNIENCPYEQLKSLDIAKIKDIMDIFNTQANIVCLLHEK
ncbi:hypothetical protein Catovirus_1_833 [Catovirus CTV1]|mgnify:CR=1 FL=1|uniref:Uncharacterized protein n=1 Tax=Catovirus CTV1 TaxID=1977631 RepID=A0A1V0SAR1_9VIRU|nr:hypothetical protein Catovirus_1_833 [Catovirus CTV1]